MHTLYITVDGLRNNKHENSVAVIFGNKVNEDGTLSPRLKARLDKGVELYKQGLTGYIIVSGGLGKEGFYEGDKMRDYLLTQAIPADVIIVDNKGDNTLATVKNTIAICKQRNFPFAIAVSQYYHITRIKTMFKQEGKWWLRVLPQCILSGAMCTRLPASSLRSIPICCSITLWYQYKNLKSWHCLFRRR
ncbi:MAG: YdcF family protein [Sphingobacteriales bacterium JAD_PAG50586_3]|nr:MAG: YdcF family protein [Sphingobacteriales bacterium JAD_PAG50586_3]